MQFFTELTKRICNTSLKKSLKFHMIEIAQKYNSKEPLKYM